MISRREMLKLGGVAMLAAASPSFFVRNAWAEKAIGNFPVKGKSVFFGFNVPQTGSYADEGADELRAYKLAAEHINNGGGMMETMQPIALEGSGVLGKKVEYVVGDTQTNPDAARTSARRMIERDKVIMYGGGSSSAVAIGGYEALATKVPSGPCSPWASTSCSASRPTCPLAMPLSSGPRLMSQV